MTSPGKILGRLSESIAYPGEFQWLLHDCYDDIVQTDYYLDSPEFSFSDCSWNIRIHTKGLEVENENWISLFLMRKNSNSEKKINFVLSLEFQGEELAAYGDTHTFKKNTHEGWGFHCFIPREDVLDCWSAETKDPFQLSIQIAIINYIPSDKDKQGIEYSYWNSIPFLHDRKYNLVLKVKDQYFKAHHHVLVSRCPNFMLAHGMWERNRCVVEIPDCDPADFGQFLVYAYTGEIMTPNENVIPPLYHFAVKYNMKIEQQRCCEVIKKSLSPRNVSDVIRLSLKYNDFLLREMTEKYFVDNAKEILVTAEWQSFIKENPIRANELFIIKLSDSV